MKRTLLTLTLSAVLVAGCGTDSSTSFDAAAGGPPESVPVTPADPTSTTVASTNVSTPAPDSSPSTVAAPVPPAPRPGWKTCTNAGRGYSISYPDAWHTDSPAATECRYFDPEPVEFTPYSDGFLFALMVGTDQGSFEDARRPETGPYSQTLLHEETTIAGRQAVRFEVELNGDGPSAYPGGTRFYGYNVENAGGAFGVITYWIPTHQPMDQYREWKLIVDQAVATLQFR